jgi:hypothetical protein
MIIEYFEPSGNVSSQDDLWHIATSDNSGVIDMKYVFDVYHEGVQLIRSKIYPEPSNGYGYFNAGRIIQNQITYDWFKPNADLLNTYMSYLYEPSLDNEIAITYDVLVGEDVSGITTLNMASGSVTAWNFRPGLFNRRANLINSKEDNFLTNRPLVAKLGLTEKLLVPFYTSSPLTMNCKTYDSNNQLVFDITSPDTYTPTNGFIQLDLGVNSVHYTTDDTYITGDTKYYIVSFVELPDVQFKIFIDCEPLYSPINLYFMNQYGMFDTARFSKASKLYMDIERKTYQQRDFRFNNNSVQYSDANNVYRESKINYGSKSNWTYKLNMDFPNDAEWQWLVELIQTPQCYAYIDGDFYPVTIKATNYEFMNYTNDRLKPFVVEIEMNQTRYGHSR